MIPTITTNARFGHYMRMTDGAVDISEWTFEKLYNAFCNFGYFKSTSRLGKLLVSYDNGEKFIDFIPSYDNKNRHQCMALAMFIDSVYRPIAYVECPHEHGLNFKALFRKVSNTDYKYTNDTGKVILFKFDNSCESQFAELYKDDNPNSNVSVSANTN